MSFAYKSSKNEPLKKSMFLKEVGGDVSGSDEEDDDEEEDDDDDDEKKNRSSK
jgi:hypothetical protein